MRTLPLILALVLPAAAAPRDTPYDKTVELIARLYLEPEKVEEGAMLRAAAGSLSDELPWLIVDGSGATVTLRHGSGAAIGSLSVGSVDTLPAALEDLEAMVRGSGYPVGDVDLRLAILDGLTDALDRYSRILADDVRDRFDVRLKGTLVGIGATLRWVDGALRIVDLLAGGPAEQGGLRIGDEVLRIDGRSVVSMPVSEAARRMRGDDGTQVVLTVRRGAGELDIALTRAEVILPNVTHRVLEGSVGYVAIENVSQKTVHNLLGALDALKAEGALDNGLVLDLRGNTGGSMKEAARAADLFVDGGMLLRTEGRDGGRVENLQDRMEAVPGGIGVSVPLAIVVDAHTASGSEILAGALVELDRAVLVGVRTYGKGSVQKLYPLDATTELKLTVAHYVLANDRQIDQLGLVPDAVVGTVEVEPEGVRYLDFDESWQRTQWDDIVPWVRFDESYPDRGQPDLPVELARRAVVAAAGPSRGEGLVALADAARALRVEEEGRLTAAMEQRRVNWSPVGEDSGFIEADVEVQATRWEGRTDVLRVQAAVHNRGAEPLARALVQLTGPGTVWDGLVVPVGAVAAGGDAAGEVALRLEPGIARRLDPVQVRLRAAGRAPLPVGEAVLESASAPSPDLRLTARLVPDGDGTARAEVTVINDSDRPVYDVEVRFAWPGDLDVELIDQAVRLPLVAARDRVRADLELRPGPEAPPVLPLQVRVESAAHGALIRWPLSLPMSGSTVALSAPRVGLARPVVQAPEGTLELPLEIQDDGAVDYVVVYAHGEKVAWAPGGKGRLKLAPTVEIWPGGNAVFVEVGDDDGIVTVEEFHVLGESATAAVDATDE